MMMNAMESDDRFEAVIRGVYAQDELRLFNARLVSNNISAHRESTINRNLYVKDYTRGSASPSSINNYSTDNGSLDRARFVQNNQKLAK